MKKLLMGMVLAASCAMSQAQTAQEILNDGKNTDNVLTFGMGMNLHCGTSAPPTRWASCRSRRSTTA
jgi:hypothetical protein